MERDGLEREAWSAICMRGQVTLFVDRFWDDGGGGDFFGLVADDDLDDVDDLDDEEDDVDTDDTDDTDDSEDDDDDENEDDVDDGDNFVEDLFFLELVYLSLSLSSLLSL